MNFWYHAFAELPIEIEDEDGGLHPKGREYKNCESIEEIAEKIKGDHALLDQAFVVFYDKPKNESIDITWKVRALLDGTN
jgi:hypothetical protein